MEYNRIIYPERAEYLNESIYSGYKVFLDHWDGLVADIKSSFEESLLRKVSKSIIIYGEQSTGKTLFASKLNRDFMETQSSMSSASNIRYDNNNIWHRVVSGFGKNTDLIEKSSRNSVFLHIEDDTEWVKKAKELSSSNSDRTCVVIADNCERDYFIQGLLGLSDTEYLATGRTDALVTAAAQRYVALCRSGLRGALIIMFTNDDIFSLKFEEEVNKQHKKLVSVINLPIPDSVSKETVVRVNTNRLNPFSYWYCLDKAGVDEKLNAHAALSTSTSFKDSFEAIDGAIKSADASRVGRPPKKCLLTLFVLTNSDDVSDLLNILDADNKVSDLAQNRYINSVTFRNNWRKFFDFEYERQGKLLESEWSLRIVVAGNQFADELLNGTNQELTKELIEKVLVHHGPGTRETTLEKHKSEIQDLLNRTFSGEIDRDLSEFWSIGQIRASQYEKRLSEILESYDKGHEGFLTYRPDYVVEKYRPCKLTSCEDNNISSINDSIRRTAITCEFTAVKEFNLANVTSYLNRKLKNYVEVVQEQ
ncbi:hypothetical protein [Halomonas sp. CKK8]|uniref:hypothetical protein n=1 Tax=Halomonas sp. CKK8 TaxID=3036127 RepID=UPI0024150320|nr:hypothetical protein [Halomonas sp. CKK8]WFM72445.1 hypothetical protein P8934_05445 [Halomonas sp. CKK8]